MSLEIRAARPDDVDVAVPMLRASMGGLANYLFDDPRRTLDEYLAGMYQAAGHRFSWTVSFVAEQEGKAVGYLLSYPGRALNGLQLAFLRKFPGLFGWGDTLRLLRRTLPLLNAPEAESDEYYVSNIGVVPQLRNLEHGTHLMAFAESRARLARLMKCSLAVDETNTDAIRLYERLGYRIVFTRRFSGQLAEKESGYHRMVKPLTA
ncbi:MAG TPA: GNAT family N-acetyltransferase [Anaerolineales bacterium]